MNFKHYSMYPFKKQIAYKSYKCKKSCVRRDVCKSPKRSCASRVFFRRRWGAKIIPRRWTNPPWTCTVQAPVLSMAPRSLRCCLRFWGLEPIKKLGVVELFYHQNDIDPGFRISWVSWSPVFKTYLSFFFLNTEKSPKPTCFSLLESRM